MPLPTDPSACWPPKAIERVLDRYAEHSAWYSSDPQQIADYYARAVFTPTPQGHMWARETRDRVAQAVHMPLPADLATVSADLLFAEAPTLIVPNAQGERAPSLAKEQQERLNRLIDQAGVLNKLLEAAETAAALGGVFIRPVWDVSVASFPFINIVQPDTAVPEFAWGMLRAVTFWRVVAEDGDDVWRHLERHEIGPNGHGWILHGLYRGNYDRLGVSQSLDRHPSTAGLKAAIDTGIIGLDVRYVPNMLPNRTDRGSPLGTSDYQGKEALFASLDEAWTSLIAELQLCKARMFVPEDYVIRDSNGTRFNPDDQLFVTLNIDPMASGNTDLKIQQPQIRVAEHLQLTQALVVDIVSRCGYAPQTFGLNVDGTAPSGTALKIRERRSITTLGKKQRYWKSAVQDVLCMLMQLDYTMFGGVEPPERITVSFADSVAPDVNELATTANLLKQAEAASVEARVRLVHPDWGDPEVLAEVEKIRRDLSGGMGGDPTFGALDMLDAVKRAPRGTEESEEADEE